MSDVQFPGQGYRLGDNSSSPIKRSCPEPSLGTTLIITSLVLGILFILFLTLGECQVGAFANISDLGLNLLQGGVIVSGLLCVVGVIALVGKYCVAPRLSNEEVQKYKSVLRENEYFVYRVIGKNGTKTCYKTPRNKAVTDIECNRQSDHHVSNELRDTRVFKEELDQRLAKSSR